MMFVLNFFILFAVLYFLAVFLERDFYHKRLPDPWLKLAQCHRGLREFETAKKVINFNKESSNA